MLFQLLTIFVLFFISPIHSQQKIDSQEFLSSSSPLHQTSNSHIQQSQDSSIFAVPFVGQWEIVPTTSSDPESDITNSLVPLQLFENQSGKVRFSFNTAFQLSTHLLYYQPPDPTTTPKNFSEFQVILIDGEYHDDSYHFYEFVHITLNELEIDNTTQTMSFNKTLYLDGYFCKTTVSMRLNDIISPENWSQGQYFIENSGVLSLKMNSTDCNFNLTASLTQDHKDYSSAKTHYDIFFRILLLTNTILNIFLFNRMFPYSLNSAKIQSFIPVLLGIWDLIWFLNMYTHVTEYSQFIYLFELCFFEFPSAVFLMLPILLDAQNFHGNNLPTNLTTKEYVYLVMSVFGLIFLIFSIFIFLNSTFLFFTSLIFLPQIISNINSGALVTFDLPSILLVIGVRPLIPFYFKGCSENIFQIESSLTLCFAIIISLALQVYFLYLQAIHGARFFIPKSLAQCDYDYFLDASVLSSIQQENNQVELVKMTKTCKICMEKLKEPPHHEEIIDEKAKEVLDKIGMKPEKIMKTECRHRFHAICLVEWMMVKMECPQCGMMLAPLFKK